MQEEHKKRQARLLIAVTLVGLLIPLGIPPIPQDPAYHQFADQRTFWGIPHFWNVVSNLPFVFVGVFGLTRMLQIRSASLRSAYIVFCIGIIGVGGGSAYYHLAPSTPRLVLDRLPMTVAFMALFAIVVHHCISETVGRVILWPLVFVGVASVGYWYGSERYGQGDLRPYGVVQFLPLILMPLMLITGKNQNGAAGLWSAFGAYAFAKVMEHRDAAIFDALGIISGHSLKHLLGALAGFGVLFAVSRFR